MSQAARQRYSYREYLELEAISPVKHEFLAGEVWAMAGGSPEHAAIAGNVVTLLSTQLRNARCRVYTSDLRIRVRATGLGTYPDVSVVCGQLELDSDDPKRQTVVNPKVLVEVTSPSTEDYDRGEKLAQYQKIESLEEVVLVAHDTRRIDVWRREQDEWTHFEVHTEGAAELKSIGCQLSLPEVYRDPLA